MLDERSDLRLTGRTVAAAYSDDGLRRAFAQRGLDIFRAQCVMWFVIAGAAATTSSPDAWLDRMAAIAWCLAGALVIWRIVRCAVVIDKADLTVRSFWRTRHLSAGEIRLFLPPRPFPTWVGNGIRIRLASGAELATGVFVATPAAPRPAAREVEELNAWLVDVASGGPQPRWFRPADRSWLTFVKHPLTRAAGLLLLFIWLFEIGLLIGLVAAPTAMSG